MDPLSSPWHRQRHRSYDLTFWSGETSPSVSADPSTANWAVIEQAAGEPMLFRWPDQQALLKSVGRMLDQAFADGDRRARQEIRRAITGVIARQEVRR